MTVNPSERLTRGALVSYGKLCTEFYDIDKPQEPSAEFDFYLNRARAAPGPILAVMCGSGRFLLPLLEQGFDVEGLDLSPFMLAACRRRGETRGLQPVVHEQGLASMALRRKYALAFVASASICLLTDPDELMAGLRRIHDALLEGGKLVLAIKTPQLAGSCSWPWGGRWVRREDGATLLLSWLGEYDAKTRISRNIHRYELVEHGRLVETEIEHWDLRYYEPEEFQGILEAAGFEKVRCSRAYRDAPPEPGDDQVAFECIRGSRTT